LALDGYRGHSTPSRYSVSYRPSGGYAPHLSSSLRISLTLLEGPLL